MHLFEQAVEPPGTARNDMEIWLDHARRLGQTDKDGAPLPAWGEPEEAFEAWKRCTAGRSVDHTGLSDALRHERGGTQWPCNADAPDGTERLYVDAG